MRALGGPGRNRHTSIRSSVTGGGDHPSLLIPPHSRLRRALHSLVLRFGDLGTVSRPLGRGAACSVSCWKIGHGGPGHIDGIGRNRALRACRGGRAPRSAGRPLGAKAPCGLRTSGPRPIASLLWAAASVLLGVWQPQTVEIGGRGPTEGTGGSERREARSAVRGLLIPRREGRGLGLTLDGIEALHIALRRPSRPSRSSAGQRQRRPRRTLAHAVCTCYLPSEKRGEATGNQTPQATWSPGAGPAGHPLACGVAVSGLPEARGDDVPRRPNGTAGVLWTDSDPLGGWCERLAGLPRRSKRYLGPTCG